MAHAHLSNLKILYSKNVFSFHQGTAVCICIFFKKCLFLGSEYKAHKMKFFKHRSYSEKAALLLRHITVIKVTYCRYHILLFFFSSKSTGILCFHPVAEESLQSQRLLFHRIANFYNGVSFL